MAYYGPPPTGGLAGDHSSSGGVSNLVLTGPASGSSAGGSSKSITPKPDQIDYSKIFVGGLSWSSTEESLQAYFEQFGPVVNVEIMKDRNTGNPRGFCFIVFTTDATVEKIMQHGKHTVDDKVVDVKRAQARGTVAPSMYRGGGVVEQPQPIQIQQPTAKATVEQPMAAGVTINPVLSSEQTMNKLFVGGLHLAVDNDEMKRYFEQYGKVVDSIVMSDPVQKRSRGFGFITYEEGSDGAQKAMLAQPHSLRDKYVEIKYAQPKAAVAPSGGNIIASTSHKEGIGEYAGGNHATTSAVNYHRGGKINIIHNEFYGLANAYGRNGWKAGYGTLAFGKAGWNVVGWETFAVGNMPERTGFSFELLKGTPIWDVITEEDHKNEGHCGNTNHLTVLPSICDGHQQQHASKRVKIE